MPTAHAPTKPSHVYNNTSYGRSLPAKQDFSTLNGDFKAVSKDLRFSSSAKKPRDSAVDHQHSGFLCQAIGQDPHPLDCRPDSPTSLEDSQSESGAESAETTDTEHSTIQSPNCDGTVIARSKLAKAEPLNIMTSTSVSRLQVATPPLSPVKMPLVNEPLDQPLHTDDYEDEAPAPSCATTSPENELATTASVPKPAVAQSLLKVSTWSTFVPRAAFVPTLKSPASTFPSRRSARRADHLRLHERFPIVLPPEVEAKLSMEMVDLFESLLPTEESHIRRTKLIQKIRDILHTEWPGRDITAHPFGSTVNDLGTSSSDVDICIMTSWPGLKNVQILANVFRKHGMQKVFCVPRAKVPIVKVWDPELHLSCDVNINTPLGVLNSEMIKTYVAIDPRVRPFAMIIKHWARRRVLNDAANGGTISTYTWICIVINFLQMRSPPILPKLHQFPHTLSEDNQVINGNNTSFCRDIERLEGFGLSNKETLGGLLYAFFRRFAIEFDYDHHVISVRDGCYLTKESKGWHIPGKYYKLFCVEEPFDTSRNLGNSSDLTSCMGLKDEFKRALEILHRKGSLNDCCAQFVFPASYYHSNINTRKSNNGAMSHYSYGPGRRYLNGYRTRNNYYDDDYGDDDEDYDDPAGETSVMETLNIGTRLPTNFDPTGGSKLSSSSWEPESSLTSRRGNRKSGSDKSQSSKDQGLDRAGAGTGAGQMSEPLNHTGPQGEVKKGKGEEGATETVDAGSTRGSKQNKTATSGTDGRRKKSKKNNKKSRNNNGNSGNSSRGPSATVEFNLADIATAAPLLLSEARRTDQELCSQAADANATSGSVTGEESSSGVKKRKNTRKNVVWSTNSNRGESTRRQPSVKATLGTEQEKTKMIYIINEDDPACIQAPFPAKNEIQEP
ncbi:hypothetical protein B0O80DRAFT_502750 [Mortierella sp. GBAus27b]|nr:hypothetical protein BGX31_003956 [Mortierella sp. GBA43]KAI8347425.1 hypothetical protein B0O80DRAFT_502750 [Mortierella sp. GBAus27b]